MMRVKAVAKTLIFEGVLDENTSISELTSSFEKMKSEVSGEPIALDLSKVSRANSSGILAWLRFLKSAQYRFKYINTPVWLVGQFNMITGHFVGGSFVESFQAPFFAPKSQATKNLTLVVGKDLELQKSYDGFSLPHRIVDGEEYEMDIDPPHYFYFLTENYDQFLAAHV